MEVRTTLKMVVRGVSWEAVCRGLACSNVCSYIQEEVDVFLKENGLDKVPHIFMATHSMGGRDWKIVEGKEPAYFEEKLFNGGWYIFREEDVTYLYTDSATSSSSLVAEKEIGETWCVTLEVPFVELEKGEGYNPYKGGYWKAFHEQIMGEKEKSEVAA